MNNLSSVSPAEVIYSITIIGFGFLGIALWPAFLLTKLLRKKINLPDIFTLMITTITIINAVALISSQFGTPVNKNGFIKSHIAAIGLITAYLVLLIIAKYIKSLTLGVTEKVFLAVWYSLTYLLFLYFDNISANYSRGFNEGFAFISIGILIIAIVSIVGFYAYTRMAKK